jgi:hypothetical protein
MEDSMKKVLGFRGSEVPGFARALALLLALLVIAPMAPAAQQAAPAATATATLPARLSDAEFWKLVTDISEPGGYFRIVDNFTSNEGEIGLIQTWIRKSGPQGGVYMGVGPEQNFSYISAVRPSMAFITDIRRQAVMQHLMSKAIFEMAPDRAEFISLQFAKPRPATLKPETSIQETWDAFRQVTTDRELAAKTYARIVDRLTKTHEFRFTPDESSQLELVYQAFVNYGPGITTQSGGRGGGNALNFESLTGWVYDDADPPAPQSFLSTDENYQFVKSLQDRNLIVPTSGDFGGPKAIRAIGTYVREHGSTISAFYVSNVEQYLFMDRKQMAFYDNVATLPITDKTVFIRPYALRGQWGQPGALCPMGAFLGLVKDGRIYSDNDARACGGNLAR